MAKKSTSGKKPFSRDTLNDEEGSESLVGQVNALAAQDSYVSLSPAAARKPAPSAGQDMRTSADSSASVMADAPMARAAASSSVNKVYQHWADGDAARGTSAQWNNNILSDSKSDYFEGEVVPHVFYYKASNSQPLVNGQSYSFNVTYNYYQANTNAGGFLFMTTPDVDRDPSNFAGTAPTNDGSFTNGGGMLGNFQTVNANITGVSDVSYTTRGGGTMDGHVTITFVYTGATTKSGGAEIQYGLMIAAPGDVPDQGHGATQGATAWTGGSLQTTVDIGGKGAMSLQLMTSAIIDGEISGMKFNDMDGNGLRDADGVDNLAGTADDEVGMAGWTIFLDQDADGVLDADERSAVTDANGRYSFSVTPDADPSDRDNDAYVVREVQQTGWVQTSMNPEGIVITAMHPKVMDVNFGNQQPMPSLNIVKDAAVPGDTANVVGEVITYTITVQNTGNQMLTGVTVSDPMISDLMLVADAASADGELEVGESWTWTGTHVVTQADIDAGGYIVNVATADSNQTGPDTDDASVAVEQSAALNIVKDAVIAGGTANAAGEVIDYTISVSNTGNQTLTGVTVADPFASNLVLVADAASADGELDVGETWSYTASHVVTQAEIDVGTPIVNVATADSNQTGPDTDDASVAVEQTPGLNIVKDAAIAGGTANAAGEVIDYTIAVSNTGNQTLTGVTVADPFASNLVLVADAASADGELDVGETWSYTASHVVTQAEIDAGGPIVNVATADSNQTDPDTDDASVAVEQAPGLNIVKDAVVAGGTANAAGEVIDYTISVQNTGNQTLTGVTVADPFISNLTLVANAASADGELDVGETWSYTASHVVTQAEIDAGTAIVNVATADSNQTGPDTDDASVAVEQAPGLNIVKDAAVAGGTANAAGEVIDYTIAVSNTGNQTLTGVTVVDPFASNLLLVADAASADGELDVGETWSYTASHVVTQAEIDAGTPIVNVATADSNQTGPDTDDASVAVEQTPGLNIVKDAAIAGGTANAAGEVIDYTISVQNTGNQTLTGVTVVDPFASNLLLVANAASADGELDVGETWSYTASHVVTQAEMNAGTPIVNVATADSVQTSPDTDDASVAVEQAPAIAVDKAIATITGGNGNTSADAAGDVLNYTVTVSNAGNVSLTDVVVTDALTGLNVTGVSLAPGESQTYLTSYVLTQQDLDSNGGGDGYVENTATADSAQTGLVSDVEPIQVLPRASLSLNKSLVSIIGGNGNAVADAAGDVLQYTATVVNEGTVTLTNVSVTDVSTGLNVTGLTLAPGQSAVYDSTYTLTQADVDSNGDGDGYHDNIAYADSDQTAQLSDAESTPLLRTIGLGVEKNVASITGGNNNGFADLAGESLNYSINVYNAGTVTLTNVTVVDDLTGLSQTIASLAPGANQLYQTSYILTQADLDTNGGGNGYIENSTVVDSDQTLPGVDNETVQLIRSAVLYLDKTFVNVTGGNGNNLIDAVGDVLNYRIVVANPSNVTLTEVSIAEPLTGLSVNNLTLAPGQTQTYLTSYTLTQADIDNNGGGDGYIDNVAVADSAQTESVSDIESVPVLRTIGMDFDKGIVGINGGNGNDLADAAGDVLNYVFTVNNPGSVTLTNLTVVDNLTGLSETLASLAPGATVTYNSSYVLTQADLDSNAGGDGVLINTAIADTSETPTFTDSEGVTVVYQPGIDLTKYVSVDNGATWDDANGPTGPLLSSASGIDPQFRYTVTNSGNITLADVSLTDAVYDLNGAAAGTAYSFGSLAVGASAEFIFTGAAWAEGQQSGDATVSVASMPTVVDIDNAYYLGV